MGPIIVQCIIFASIFAAIGFIILNAASELPKFGFGNGLRMVGWLHIFLAVLVLFAMIVFANDSFSQTSCVNVPNTSTTVGSTTSYTWMSSCAGQEAPKFFSYMTVILTYIVMLEALALMIGMPFFLLVRFLTGRAP